MIQVGAVSMGGSSGSGCSLYGDSLERTAEWCPQLALARLLGVGMVPVTRLCQGQFTAAQPQTTADMPWSEGRLDQFAIVDRIVFQVDEPGAWPGSMGKAEADFFFGLQSPIAASMVVKGVPGYTVAGSFTPIRLLATLLETSWPQGWVLNPTESVIMKCSATTFALPSLPCSISVAFRMWSPDGSTQDFINMDRGCAWKILERDFGIKRGGKPRTDAFGAEQ